MTETTRFAPSPTGWLHLGHAYAAMYAAQAAADGRFLLRIEDLDAVRCRAAFVSAIYEDLQWLGVRWERPVLFQSTRMQAYRDALDRLGRLDVTYPCFCTRREIEREVARAGEAPDQAALNSVLYPGTCRMLSSEARRARIDSGTRYAIRLDAARATALANDLWFDESGHGARGELGRIRVDPIRLGDVVLGRSDLPASYHLAVVVDDAFQGVSLVTRGSDLSAATHTQVLLARLLELPIPRYRHHALVLDDDGRKLSKRDQSVAIRELRERGMTPDQVLQCAHAQRDGND